MSQARRIKSKPTLQDRWRYGFEIMLIGLLVVLFFNLLSWPVVPVDESLDGSWQAVLTYALERGFAFGDEVLFTYGPLGSLSSFSYSGYNHAGKYAFELFMRFSVVIFLFRFLPNLKPYVKLGCLFLYLFVLQFLPDVYETYFFFGMFSWVAALVLERPRKHRKPLALIAVGVAYVAVASLVKFTLLLAGIFCIGIVVTHFFWKSRRAEAVGILGGYLLATLALWTLLGQSLSGIPLYLYGSYQVAKGYAMSMQLPMLEGGMKYFWLLLLSSAALVAVVLKENLRKKMKATHLKQPWFPLMVLYLGFFFMVWKQGMVRSDGHIWQFICYVPLVAWFVYPVLKKRGPQVMFASLMVVQFFLMLSAMVSFYPHFLSEVPGRVWKRTAEGVDGLINPTDSMNELRAAFEQRGNALVQRYPLLNSVGDRSVDVVGDHQGLAILAQLNYQPRPVFQNYVANNAYLQTRNGTYWAEENNPDFVIQALDAIDGTLPTQSDSQTLLHLLHHYQYEETSGRYVLLSKRQVPATPSLGETETVALKFGEPTQLPQEVPSFQITRFNVSLNILGRMRAFFFKPPVLHLSTMLSHGSSHRHRFNPVTAELESLLAPSIHSADQMWQHRAGNPPPQVTSLTLEVEPLQSWFFQGGASVSVTPLWFVDEG